MKLKAVFIDHDGTIIPDSPVRNNVTGIALSEDVVEGLQLLQTHGYLLVVVSGSAKEGVPEEQQRQQEIAGRLNQLCLQMGIYLDGFYYPASEGAIAAGPDLQLESGMIKAAGEMDIDLSSSWMIGGIPDDVMAGKSAGCKTILIGDEQNTVAATRPQPVPMYQARGFAEAARYISAVTN